MFLSSTNSSKKDISIIVDIGSCSVGAAILGTDLDGKSKIFYSTRFSLCLPPLEKSENSINDLLSAVKKVSIKLTEEGLAYVKSLGILRNPDKVFVTLSSPWCFSSVNTVTHKEKKTFKISAGLIGKLLLNEENLSANRLKAGILENGKKEEAEIVERKIVEAKINGYYAKDVYDEEANELEVSIIASLALKKVTDGIRDIVNKILFPKTIEFHSFTLVSLESLQILSKKDERFIFLNITGEETEIIVIKEGVVSRTDYFSMGSETLKRELVKNFSNISSHIAISLLCEYSTGKHLSENLKQASEKVLKIWNDELKKRLKSLSLEVFLPKKILISVDKELESVYSKIIKDLDSSNVLITDERFDVDFVNQDYIAEKSGDFDKQGHDTSINLETIFINNLNNKRSRF